jgi:hypothetical protein
MFADYSWILTGLSSGLQGSDRFGKKPVVTPQVREEIILPDPELLSHHPSAESLFSQAF